MVLVPGYRELPLAEAGHAGALSCAWVRVVGPGEEGGVRVLPDACTDLVWRAGHGTLLAGPDTTAQLSPTEDGDVLVGVRFAPGAGGPALGVALADLRDLRVDASEVGVQVAGDLDAPEALRRLGAVAADRCRAAPPDAAVQEAARRLARGAPVRTLAADLGLSERQLRRRCLAAAGLAPKTLARVLRFGGFLARADAASAAPDLGRLALEAGYADQAHLTNECTRLAGLPPAALMRARAAGPPGAGSAGRPTR